MEKAWRENGERRGWGEHVKYVMDVERELKKREQLRVRVLIKFCSIVLYKSDIPM